MQDRERTKSQLISESAELRQKVAETGELAVVNRQFEKKFCRAEGLSDAIIDSISDPLHVIDSDLRFIMYNDAFSMWCKKLGFETDVIGKKLFEMFPFLSQEAHDEYRKVFKTGETSFSTESNRFGEKEIISEVSKSPIITGNKVEQVVTVVRDITERRRSDKALRESEEKLRTLIESSHEMVFSKNRDGRYHTINLRAAAGLGGTCIEDIVGKTDYDLMSRVKADALRRADKQVMENDEAIEVEEVVCNSQGEDRVYLSRKWPTYDNDGKVDGIACFAMDITESKKAEEALQESEERFRAFMDNGPFQAQIKDKTFRYVFGDADILRERALTLEEFTRTTSHDTLPKDIADEIEAADRMVLEENVTVEMEQFLIMKNGEKRWFNNIKFPIHGLGGETEIGGIAMDITERKRVVEALRESEEKYRSFIENFQGIAFRGKAGEFFRGFFNGAVEDITGYSADELVAGKPCWDQIVHPEDLADMQETAREATEALAAVDVEYRIIHRDGRIRWVRELSHRVFDDSEKAPSAEGVVYDITDRKETEETLRKTEEQLRQAQKLESVGRLAGGVAHDFNNLLTTMIGYLELISMEQGLSATTAEGVQEIRNSADRAAALTQQLLAFSRKQVLQPQVINLNRLITKLSKMLRRLIGEDINLNSELDSKLGQIKADPGQIEQVIMNLAINAKDAMPKGGTLTIETQGVYIDESYHHHHPQTAPGNYVLLAVSDTGHGMDEETKKHVFDPFYTTKKEGKGTGLGLSTVYGIVKQSDGFIWAHSEPGQGTTFKIYLPQRTGTIKQQEPLLVKQKAKGGTETILLVEDDESLRKLAKRILEGYGYGVIEAKNGIEALEITTKGDHPKIDLLVSDVIMPKMSGKELADKLKEEYPRLGVLYISGYTDKGIAHHGVLDEGVSFLQKPFSPKSLAEKVREILDER